MQTLRQMRIGPRLTLAFSTVFLLLLLLGGFGIYEMNQTNAHTRDLGTNWLPSVEVLGDLRGGFNEARRTSLRVLLESTPEGKREQLKVYEHAAHVRVPKLFAEYEPMIASAEERKAYEEIRASWNRFVEMEVKQSALALGSPEEAEQARQMAIGPAGDAFLQALNALKKDIAINVEGANRATTDAEKSYRQALIASIVIVSIALVVCSVLAVSVTRSIVKPLNTSVAVAQAVSEGDLTSKFEVTGRDEPAVLLEALRHMNSRLVEMVTQIRHSSDSIATGSAEIAIGNSDLSHRTEQQASNLEEAAASMEELTSTVKINSDTALQASSLAANASQSAEHGGTVMSRVVATMQDISASSKKISDIIGVIDGIAFQTNILALNAAVEAARAGEQGRGFAVVASEVRQLATRSAEAAKEIKHLIHTSVERVENGANLVDEAGQSMDGLVSQVKRVGILINEISSASREQSSGISQIGEAVNQLDQVTQQNAALVEESAAAAESLKSQSQRLSELVSVFKIDD